MALVTLPNLGPDPFTVNASVLNGKVDPLATDYNGNIQNVNIAAGAGIVYSKLSLTDGILNADINSSAGIVASKLDLSPVAQTIEMSSKAIMEAKGANIASATTTTIWATDGNLIHITGTTTITGFGTATQAGEERTLIFDGALTLTHNATTLKLPGGANITTAANDRAIVRADTTANAIVVSYVKADGTPVVGATVSTALSGSVIQTVNTITGAVATGTTTIPNDDTIPQITEGDQYMTLAITPNNASNYLKISVVWNGTSNTADEMVVALFQDSTANALACVSSRITAAVDMQAINFTHYMTAGTTSSTTFRVRAGLVASNTTTFNGRSGGRLFGGVMASSITIEEIKA